MQEYPNAVFLSKPIGLTNPPLKNMLVKRNLTSVKQRDSHGTSDCRYAERAS